MTICFYIGGSGLAFFAPRIQATFSLLLMFLSGILYNLPPIRLKDVPYVDFMFEAVNNPIRLAVGWYAITEQIVPSSLLLTYWFFGMFLMAAKRFGELRSFVNKTNAGLYRKSFKTYTERKLLILMIMALTASAYMLGALSLKHAVDMILFLPVMMLWIAWFFNLAYEKDTIVKDPERIFERPKFFIYSAFAISLFLILFFTKAKVFNFLQ